MTAGDRPLRAITFDYWDTLYLGAEFPPRKERRRAALHRMLAEVGCTADAADIDRLLHQSAVEADRWWREEHRGYTADERIRWILDQLSIERPTECEHIAAAVRAVDDALLAFPPTLFPGTDRMLTSLAPLTRLAIISDTGFSSGRAQDALLAHHGLLDLFEVTVYSMDIGHAKPRPEPFQTALAALGLDPAEVLHVGDNERTDVGGALAIGMRAVRVDIIRANGDTAAEFVARSVEELEGYLLSQLT